MFPVASMLVSLYHTVPQLIILIGACLPPVLVATARSGPRVGWAPPARVRADLLSAPAMG